MAALRSFLGIPGPLQLLFFLLLRDLVVGGQNVEITQRPESLSVTAGETLNLTCTLIGKNLPGGVRWYKGLDRSQLPIYSDKEGASNRGVRAVPGSSTDFSISIRDILPEDAGTYYCVKFRAGNPERQLASGKGTVVSVIARPSQPLLRGPPGRIMTGSRASFNCSSEGFSPREITVTWLKDGKEIEEAQTRILDSGEQQSTSYRVESTVEVLLGKGDVRSQLTCQIQHSSLEAPLQQDFPLGDILTASPSQPLLRGPPGRIRVGSRASFNCSAEGFSSRNITVTWSKDGKRIWGAQTKILNSGEQQSISSRNTTVTRSKDGKRIQGPQIKFLKSGEKQSTSYRVESMVEVLLRQEDMRSQLTCQIQHSSLEAPLQQDFRLGAILRVPPRVHIDTSPPAPVQVNTTVMVTCNAEHFYPDDAKMDFFTKNPSTKGKVDPMTLNSDGTSSLKGHMKVIATEDRNSSLFTCLVKHNSRPAIKRTATLFVRTKLEESSPQQSTFGLWMGLFLNKIGLVVFLLGLFRIKERRCCVARSFAGSSQEVRQAESST
ncbi:signal-regulatory protein gamma-like isoform 2-T2 [Liasis olivaceus]